MAERQAKTTALSATSTVWIVDDSPLEAEMARRTLAANFQVELFADGPSVLEVLANKGPPDLLVLDWQLPGMSGIEICRFVRGTLDEVTLPILMLTVQGHKPDIVEGLSAGANDYLTKPYDATELTARATGLLRTRRLNDELRAERARLHELFSSLPAFFAVSEGPEHTLRFINPAFRAALGDQEVTGRPLSELRAELGAHKLLALWDHAYSSGEPANAPELPLRVTRPNGARENALLDVSVLPQRGVSGRVEGVLAFAVEVTAQVQAKRHAALAHEERETLLAHAQEASLRAEQANRAKDDFLATVSHELRTPLNAILGWVTLLKNGSLPPDRTAHALTTIDRNARAQTQLIDDLLDVSRIISGKLRLSLEPTDIGQVIRAAVDTLRPSAEAKQLRIGCEINAPDTLIMADGTRLQQVIWNLVTNAVKFTPAGGNVEVRLEANEVEARVVVSDDGQGVPGELLPHVFDRFRQAETSFTRTHGGLGLGLAIVRHIVDLHGGSVNAYSAGSGRGATFTVRLPLLQVRSSPHSRRTASTGLLAINRLGGLRVLLVDDDADGREVIAALLLAHGAQVDVAASAREALTALDKAVPDILVSDIGMPDEDGLSLLRKVRARSSAAGGTVPAIALTAYARAEDRTKSLMAGFNTHVTKPVEATELVMALANLTGRFERDEAGPAPSSTQR